jgi:uncharacterized repeat protein (TIGR04052 family)
MRRNLFAFAALASTAFALGACSEEEHDHDHDHDATTDAGTDTSGADAHGGDTHGGDSMPVALRFDIRAGDTDVACGAELVLGTDSTPVTITDARFYVHGVELLDADGMATAVTLDQDGTWQIDDIALLDFEDGTGPCVNGNELLNDTVRGTVPMGTYTGIRFILGVPQARNHAAADTAPAPLNYTSMWWNWQGGYKFVRIDGDNAAEGLFFHLGSTGCTGEPPNIEACARPNRPEVMLTGFDPAADAVVFDVQTLWAGAPAATNTEGTRPGCMSAADDPECGPVLATLGLDADGQPTAAQTVFSVASN